MFITLHLFNGDPVQVDPENIEWFKPSDDRYNPTAIKLKGMRGTKIKETVDQVKELCRQAGKSHLS